MSDDALKPRAGSEADSPFVRSARETAAIVPSCAACGQPITSTYYTVKDVMVCPDCCDQANSLRAGGKFGRLVKASVLGIGAGLIGAFIWFAIRRLAHLEIGLVAILVGFMVGKAVRVGSGDRGGLVYQIMAVVVTYCCIAANYMPDIFEAVFEDAVQQPAMAAEPTVGDDREADSAVLEDSADDAAADEMSERNEEPVGMAELIGATLVLVLAVFVISLQAPFLAGMDNLIGLLIIGFALWEAWKFNTPESLQISGPHQVVPAPSRSY